MWGRRRSWDEVPAKTCECGVAFYKVDQSGEGAIKRIMAFTMKVAYGIVKTYIEKMKFIGCTTDAVCKKQDIAF